MEADVLVGADGIWSAIRAQMWKQVPSRPGPARMTSGVLLAGAVR